jgi:hypothetical protein
MSWADFYRRRDAIDQVLAYAGRHDDAALPFDELTQVPAIFGSRAELALALQYKWSQALTGRVTVALADAERAPEVDHVQAVADAWRATARANPQLRRLLDEHEPDSDFREALRAEQRMLAYAAGLADLAEPADEATRIGAAFLALVRGTPDRVTRRTNPVEQLFRRLVASS